MLDNQKVSKYVFPLEEASTKPGLLVSQTDQLTNCPKPLSTKTNKQQQKTDQVVNLHQ